jgi:ATP-dependent DNA helicase DinG
MTENPLGGQLQAALSVHLKSFEPRAGQREMIAAIDEAIRDGHDVVVEAGTGTGKTLAYLLPILYAGRRAIIATATKQLQNQIVEYDLPVALSATGANVDTAVLKGRSNYICLHRLQEREGRGGAGRHEEVQAVHDAALHSASGDIAEVTAVDEGSAVWPAVTSTSDNCLGSECAFYEECFVVKARRAALVADLVIVNHHVLLADYALRDRWDGASLLGDAEVIVIDEAHALADVVSHFFGMSISSRRTTTMCTDLAGVAAAVGGHEGAAIGGAADAINLSAREFWAATAGKAAQQMLDDVIFGRICEPRDELVDTLRDQWRLLGAPGLVNAAPEVQLARDAIEQLEHDLCVVIDRHDDGGSMVRWIERRARATVLYARPADCGPILQRTLLSEASVRVFTSATLAVGEDFGPFLRATGQDEATVRMVLPGSFDYPSQALLYLPRHVPEPWTEGREAGLAKEICRLCEASMGGAFALFTSRKSMNDAHWRVASQLDMTCLLQGTASKKALLERFQQMQPAVLFATMGFWQGVDLPGDILRLVVLDKVPFPPPGDPLFAARAKRVEKAGKSSFSVLSIPAAAIMLRQGFGRLIRGTGDRGVVAILDPRLTRRGYGKRLLHALPPARRSASFADVQAFFDNHADHGTFASL